MSGNAPTISSDAQLPNEKSGELHALVGSLPPGFDDSETLILGPTVSQLLDLCEDI